MADTDTRLTILETETANMGRKVDKTNRILTGDDEPAKGLVHKVTILEVTMNAIKNRLGMLVGVSTAILIGLLTHAALSIFGVI